MRLTRSANRTSFTFLNGAKNVPVRMAKPDKEHGRDDKKVNTERDY